MPAARLCLDGVGTWDEIVTRSHDGPIVDGRSACLLARQNGGLYCIVFSFILDDQQATRAHTGRVPSQDKATESAPRSATDVHGRSSTFSDPVALPLDLRTDDEEHVAANKFYKWGHWQRFCCGGGKSPGGQRASIISFLSQGVVLPVSPLPAIAPWGAGAAAMRMSDVAHRLQRWPSRGDAQGATAEASAGLRGHSDQSTSSASPSAIGSILISAASKSNGASRAGASRRGCAISTPRRRFMS
eukprot:1297083-Pleurochrysis_carterae.AAC.2